MDEKKPSEEEPETAAKMIRPGIYPPPDPNSQDELNLAIKALEFGLDIMRRHYCNYGWGYELHGTKQPPMHMGDVEQTEDLTQDPDRFSDQ